MNFLVLETTVHGSYYSLVLISSYLTVVSVIYLINVTIVLFGLYFFSSYFLCITKTAAVNKYIKDAYGILFQSVHKVDALLFFILITFFSIKVTLSHPFHILFLDTKVICFVSLTVTTL